MKLVYTLKSISGSALFARFAAAINEDGIGHDNEGEWSASLSENGKVWTTNWSRFTYTIVNPESNDSAIVEYDGGFRGFLAQNLIPDELRGETVHAEVTEGSALERHGVEKFVHTDAALLAEAYGLMQRTKKDFWGRKVLEACLRAIEGAREVSRHMAEIGIQGNTSWAHAGNGKAFAASNIEDGDPSIFVTCCPGGRQVTVEFSVDVTPPEGYLRPEEHSLTEAADQAKAWLDQLRPVLNLAAA